VVIDCLLAKDPAERFQTAEEVSRALVHAVPSAAGDSVRLGRSRAVAVKSLVRTSVAGCLAFIVLLAGAGVVTVTVFSKPPRIAAAPPIPDGLTRALRHQGALAAGDVAQYVFAPGGREDTTLLVVARRSVAVVTPQHVRAYPRDGVRVRYAVDLRNGLLFRLVLQLPRARRDTVFRSLSLRDVYELVPRLGKLLGADQARGTVDQ
jgi:hypothetical protein